MPGFSEGEEGGVHCPADGHLYKVLTEVLKRHPVRQEGKCFIQPHTQHIFIYGRKEMFYLTMHSTHFYLWKEGNVLFNYTLNTFLFWKEGNVLFNDALNTFLFMEGRKCFIQLHTQHIFILEGRKCFI